MEPIAPTTTSPRIAMIGCGAIAEHGHLPALSRLSLTATAVLVDKNISRAQKLAAQFQVPHVAADVSEITGKADAAIVALPNALHAPIAIELLQRGIHVLVEKPMALTSAECDSMLQAAARGKAVLVLGFMRRFQWSAQFTKAILDSGMLGRIERFDLSDGFIYDWPAASDFIFRKDVAGGGVLIDFGAHGLDTLLWWFGEVEAFEYFDDNFGGVEADCEVHLTMKNGVRGVAEFSRTRNLRKTAIIHGERATLEVGLHTNQFQLIPRGALLAADGQLSCIQAKIPRPQLPSDLLDEQLRNWIGAIQNKRAVSPTGEEGLRVTALIEACYRKRMPLKLAWMPTEKTQS